MLSCIEKRFDQLLDEVESLPEENVKVLQKIRDKVSEIIYLLLPVISGHNSLLLLQIQFDYYALLVLSCAF